MANAGTHFSRPEVQKFEIFVFEIWIITDQK